jgi:hypothetical protein
MQPAASNNTMSVNSLPASVVIKTYTRGDTLTMRYEHDSVMSAIQRVARRLSDGVPWEYIGLYVDGKLSQSWEKI